MLRVNFSANQGPEGPGVCREEEALFGRADRGGAEAD